MGIDLSRDEIKTTLQVNSKREWTYSNKYSPRRVVFKKYSSEWLGTFYQNAKLDVMIDFEDAWNDMVFRGRVYKRKNKQLWELKNDQICNISKKYFYQAPGWLLNSPPGIYKLYIEIYREKTKMFNTTVSFEIRGLK